ncbi:lymphocyte antigen 6 complex locus protein G6d [Prionailurus iriomotensis]
MNSLVVGVLLGTLLGTALGNQMRCYDCKGGPSSSCKETVATCREGERCGFLERKPQPGLGPNKLSGNQFLRVRRKHSYPLSLGYVFLWPARLCLGLIGPPQ